MVATKDPYNTRQKILVAAFEEFYEHGFQGGSLNHIVEIAGATKGAVFHHFAGKHELAYAVLNEIILPILKQRWIDPVVNSADPIAELQTAFRQLVSQDIQTGAFLQGCPLNNLAQEMSPLDQGFQTLLDKFYHEWRASYAAAFSKGIAAGMIRKDISADRVATFVVASQMGVWGTGKSSRNPEVMVMACEAVCDYLECIK